MSLRLVLSFFFVFVFVSYFETSAGPFMLLINCLQMDFFMGNESSERSKEQIITGR